MMAAIMASRRAPRLQAPREALPLSHPLHLRHPPILLHRDPGPRGAYENPRHRSPLLQLPRPPPLPHRWGDFLSSFFSHAFDPFDPMWSLIDQLLGSSFTTEWPGWDVREDENVLYLRMEMLGLGKEDVRVNVEQNTLVIKGETREAEEGKGEEEESGQRRYISRIDLPPSLYKIEDIKAEMKNGVLKVVVPKVKDEERKDVFLVLIQ